MRFGLALPHYDFSVPGSARIEWPVVRDWAQRAEELGFDSLWVSDHLVLDLSKYGGPPDPQFAMECFSTLAAITQCTSRIRLGTLVACNDLRAPSLLAKMAATLSVFSGGRFDLGMGAGWYEPDYTAAGVPFERPGVRVERLAEAVRLVRGMLSNPTFSFEGSHYGVRGAWTVPQPESIALWVGGRGDRVVKTAGRYADGFNTVWAWTPEAYAGRINLLERSAINAGRDPSRIRRSVGLYCLPGYDNRELEIRWERYVAASPPKIGRDQSFRGWRRDKLAGTPGEMASKIGEFREGGAGEVILGFGLVPFQICDASAVDDFMRDTKPLVQLTG